MWVHKPREKVGDHIEAIIGAAIILSDTQFEEVTQAKWDVRWGLHLGDDPLIDAGIRLIMLSAAVWALDVRCGDIDWQNPGSVLNRGLQNAEKRGPTWEEWVTWRCIKKFRKAQSAERILRERDRRDEKRKKRNAKNGVKKNKGGQRKRRRTSAGTTGTSTTWYM